MGFVVFLLTVLLLMLDGDGWEEVVVRCWDWMEGKLVLVQKKSAGTLKFIEIGSYFTYKRHSSQLFYSSVATAGVYRLLSVCSLM